MIVYKLTNKINGKSYIGITRYSSAKRWREHLYDAKKGQPRAISGALRKHGATGFEVSILYEAADLAELKVVERGLIAQYGTLAPRGYNMTNGGDVSDVVCRSGEDSNRSLLTNEIVIFIRQPINSAITNDDMRTVVAEKFNVSVSRDCIGDARRGDRWSHLNEEYPPIKIGKGKRGDERRIAANRRPKSARGLASIARATAIRSRGNKFRAKLTAEQVLQIFVDTRLQDEIAAEYGVNQTTVSSIKLGRSWKDVTGGAIG